MSVESDLTRFLNQLLKKNNSAYHSLHAYTKQRLIQLELAQIYRPEEIIKASYLRIRNIEKSDTPIYSPSVCIRRACLHLLQGLKQIHNDENSSDFPVDKSSELLEQSRSFVDVDKEVKVLYLALASMREGDRHVLYLRHICGLSWLEISQNLAHQHERVSTIEISDIAQKGEDALQNLRLAYMSIDEEPD